jgi:hypothetical protein
MFLKPFFLIGWLFIRFLFVMLFLELDDFFSSAAPCWKCCISLVILPHLFFRLEFAACRNAVMFSSELIAVGWSLLVGCLQGVAAAAG